MEPNLSTGQFEFIYTDLLPHLFQVICSLKDLILSLNFLYIYITNPLPAQSNQVEMICQAPGLPQPSPQALLFSMPHYSRKKGCPDQLITNNQMPFSVICQEFFFVVTTNIKSTQKSTYIYMQFILEVDHFLITLSIYKYSANQIIMWCYKLN